MNNNTDNHNTDNIFIIKKSLLFKSIFNQPYLRLIIFKKVHEINRQTQTNAKKRSAMNSLYHFCKYGQTDLFIKHFDTVYHHIQSLSDHSYLNDFDRLSVVLHIAVFTQVELRFMITKIKERFEWLTNEYSGAVKPLFMHFANGYDSKPIPLSSTKVLVDCDMSIKSHIELHSMMVSTLVATPIDQSTLCRIVDNYPCTPGFIKYSVLLPMFKHVKRPGGAVQVIDTLTYLKKKKLIFEKEWRLIFIEALVKQSAEIVRFILDDQVSSKKLFLPKDQFTFDRSTFPTNDFDMIKALKYLNVSFSNIRPEEEFINITLNYGNIEYLQYLYDTKDYVELFDKNALPFALSNGYADCARFLLDKLHIVSQQQDILGIIKAMGIITELPHWQVEHVRRNVLTVEFLEIGNNIKLDNLQLAFSSMTQPAKMVVVTQNFTDLRPKVLRLLVNHNYIQLDKLTLSQTVNLIENCISERDFEMLQLLFVDHLYYFFDGLLDVDREDERLEEMDATNLCRLAVKLCKDESLFSDYTVKFLEMTRIEFKSNRYEQTRLNMLTELIVNHHINDNPIRMQLIDTIMKSCIQKDNQFVWIFCDSNIHKYMLKYLWNQTDLKQKTNHLLVMKIVDKLMTQPEYSNNANNTQLQVEQIIRYYGKLYNNNVDGIRLKYEMKPLISPIIRFPSCLNHLRYIVDLFYCQPKSKCLSSSSSSTSTKQLKYDHVETWKIDCLSLSISLYSMMTNIDKLFQSVIGNLFIRSLIYGHVTLIHKKLCIGVRKEQDLLCLYDFIKYGRSDLFIKHFDTVYNNILQFNYTYNNGKEFENSIYYYLSILIRFILQKNDDRSLKHMLQVIKDSIPNLQVKHQDELKESFMVLTNEKFGLNLEVGSSGMYVKEWNLSNEMINVLERYLTLENDIVIEKIFTSSIRSLNIDAIKKYGPRLPTRNITPFILFKQFKSNNNNDQDDIDHVVTRQKVQDMIVVVKELGLIKNMDELFILSLKHGCLDIVKIIIDETLVSIDTYQFIAEFVKTEELFKLIGFDFNRSYSKTVFTSRCAKFGNIVYFKMIIDSFKRHVDSLDESQINTFQERFYQDVIYESCYGLLSNGYLDLFNLLLETSEMDVFLSQRNNPIQITSNINPSIYTPELVHRLLDLKQSNRITFSYAGLFASVLRVGTDQPTVMWMLNNQESSDQIDYKVALELSLALDNKEVLQFIVNQINDSPSLDYPSLNIDSKCNFGNVSIETQTFFFTTLKPHKVCISGIKPRSLPLQTIRLMYDTGHLSKTLFISNLIVDCVFYGDMDLARQLVTNVFEKNHSIRTHELSFDDYIKPVIQKCSLQDLLYLCKVGVIKSDSIVSFQKTLICDNCSLETCHNCTFSEHSIDKALGIAKALHDDIVFSCHQVLDVVLAPFKLFQHVFDRPQPLYRLKDATSYSPINDRKVVTDSIIRLFTLPSPTPHPCSHIINCIERLIGLLKIDDTTKIILTDTLHSQNRLGPILVHLLTHFKINTDQSPFLPLTGKINQRLCQMHYYYGFMNHNPFSMDE
ncbi:hypothetical protein DFA_10509 [Cavenderia fasciculata]|uniref:Uncharacterized protein n=1 Tax=Cavenderia fasciculata TaxID=261658 RepID=F4QAE8_CACFS|nr:uncharacterized protein DFA_10509 [Cavenderia fasciculata]EGG15667.1 hypothetical protein DFA_10509 [Cavenderia fasciculata]|eukprot:XP_004354409.1 hypothetical protein DFA_10509 [Cavenderia fasciculata]